MSIYIYNTMSAQKERFEPVREGKVGIYCCGPTVYMNSHIGHMVGPIVFDVVKRYFTYCGYDVTLVINITDVEDKLINRARQLGISVRELADQVTEDYLKNLNLLGIDTINYMPKATEHIADIIRIVEGLIAKGFAYVANGDVYFDVTKDEDYGKLSHRRLEELVAGARVEPSEKKRHPADFALWKAAKPGEPSWDSPWGKGRPGWHIECSAMSMKYLGETFDIHGGGLDLVFPHHENEIAQSESYTGKPFVRYWMHNGLLRWAGAATKLGGRHDRQLDSAEEQQALKMSKSKGDIATVSELLTRHHPETVRFFILSTHYRRPIEFSEDRLRETDKAIQAFYRFFERFSRITKQNFYDIPFKRHREAFKPEGGPSEFVAQLHEFHDRFLAAMDDDFNTSSAIGVLFDLLHSLNSFVDRYELETPDRRTPELVGALERGASLLRELAAVLGLFRTPRTPVRAEVSSELVKSLIELLVEVRQRAREKKDYELADYIRSTLKGYGIVLEDRRDGTTWRFEE